MARLFGTDGVRGIVNIDLTIDLAMKIGAATAKTLKKDKENLTLLVASDTRISKDALRLSLASGVLSEGANIIDLGVMPTPAVSYLIGKYHVDGGFVISASHNPSEYNGIKIFNENGYKLADELENQIEALIHNFNFNQKANNVGMYEYKEDAINDYVLYLASTISSDLSHLNIALDAANGAAYKTSEALFKKLNVNYKIINNEPDGLNINQNAGSTHLENLQEFVKDNHLDCGIAFDGDADRCLMVDHEGSIIDGDKILAICGKYLKDNNELKNNTIVGTVMSNLGFVKFCEKENINFVATKVGDRYVLQNMLENDYILGGEQSGHVIFRKYAKTGDGELTALQVLNIMAETKKSLKELASVMDTYPQVLKNLEVSKESKETYQDNEVIKSYLEECNKKLNGEGRILVRPSGTENLIRVMIEGKNLEYITKMCNDIIAVMNKELN